MPIRARHGVRRHLQEDAALDQLLEPRRLRLERQAPLGVCEQDPIAPPRELVQHLLEVRPEGGIRRLHQEIAPALPERGPAQRLVRGRRRPVHVNLATADDGDRHALLVEPRRQRAAALRQLLRVHVGKSARRCGVAAMVIVPALAAAAASATLPAMSGGPSSMPGSTWEWRSITTSSGVFGEDRAGSREAG